MNLTRSSWIFTFFFFFIFSLISCAPKIGQTVISKPDEYRTVYEAKEEFVIKAIAQVFKERNLGTDVRIDEEKRTVHTDYILQDDWRIKSIARVKILNWKETEVLLSIVTEKKTGTGWEMRRLLEEEQYDTIFNQIELKIYQEMYKPAGLNG